MTREEPVRSAAGMLRQLLVGSWELQRWRIEYPATGRMSEPFGTDALGLLISADDGRMSVLMERRRRPTPAAGVSPTATDAECAAAFRSYVHYAGRWHVDGGDVVHQVEFALHPSLSGTVQRRRVLLDGDALELTGDEVLTGSGDVRRHCVDWRRAR